MSDWRLKFQSFGIATELNWSDEKKLHDSQRVIKCLCVQRFNRFVFALSLSLSLSHPVSRFRLIEFQTRLHAKCQNYVCSNVATGNENGPPISTVTQSTKHAKLFGQFETIEIPLIFTFSVFPLKQPKMELHGSIFSAWYRNWDLRWKPRREKKCLLLQEHFATMQRCSACQPVAAHSGTE